ncbi:hypothetical protein Syun_003222 [Stephania yunnanensis]|uniref:Uncharacterized protein n=1 Tax=Stephania yunnanensis TaxID=152371 RepID=A0AAP0L1U6_9MAGN
MDAAMELHLFDMRSIVLSKAPAVKWFKEWFPNDFLVRLAITGDSIVLKFEKARSALEESLRRVEDIVPQAIGCQVAGSYGLPPTPARRVLFILYQTAVPYLAERIRKKSLSLLSNGVPV